VEFANVIVVNKADLMTGAEGAADKARLMGSLRALNPSATIIESVRGNVPVRILAAGRGAARSAPYRGLLAPRCV
jgi:G3E family GTPase